MSEAEGQQGFGAGAGLGGGLVHLPVGGDQGLAGHWLWGFLLVILVDTDRENNWSMKKGIPEFRSEAEEFEFWSKADSTQYLDWSDASRVNLSALKSAMEKQRKVCRSHES